MAHLDEAIITFDDSKGPLTFGIELEFLVPALKPGQEDKNPMDPRPLFRVEDHDPCDYLDELDEFILSTLEDIKSIKIREEAMDKFVPPHDNVPRYDVWRLINDISAKADDEPKYNAYEWVGKEVTSEVLRANDPGYAEKITDMCRAIRNCRVHLNASTGVHVHVGRGDDGFTLKTVKKFSTLIWLVDTQLLSLHHPSRWDNKHCQSIRKMSQLASYTKERSNFEDLETYNAEGLTEMEESVPSNIASFLVEKLSRIWAAKDLEELANLMGNRTDPTSRNPMRSAIRGTVGFRRFLPAGKTGGNINTLEFRQMAGSLDPDHIMRWIKVCVALVDFARLSDSHTFRSVVGNVARQGFRYTSSDLLRDCGLEDEITYWEQRVSLYKSGSNHALELYEGAEHELFVPPI